LREIAAQAKFAKSHGARMSPAPPPREKPSFWRSFPLFCDLPDAVLADIDAAATPLRWSAGGVIFQRGDAGEWLVALKSGRVRLSLITQAGRELTLRHAEPGDTLGELALFDQEPRSADATAVLDTTGYVLARRDYAALACKHPALTMGVARYLSRRLRETTEQLESIALYPLEARAARFLLFTLRQLNGLDLPTRATLRLEISQTELATVLGASRPKVNRALLALAEAGALIKGPDGWDCDIPALQSLAEPDAD
jgi:CRP-like cAMP-binding protein